jgi:8-oxo-dGTP pyrophosphatase MutT (NUDIX family)
VRSIVLKHQPQHNFTVDPRPQGRSKNDRLKEGARLQALDGASLQYAALPYRLGEHLEILLITSRQTGRWILPKGWPIRGKKPHVCAAQEAIEEAGVKGRIGKSAVGSYHYLKRLPNDAAIPCSVQVFPLMVQRQSKRWPEQGQRSFGWFDAADAAALVEEEELGDLIEAFAAQQAG